MFTYPVDCTTSAQKTEYAYRCQEILRLVHNGMGRWFKEGLTQSQWSKLPVKIQNRYPYQPKLSEEQWKDFLVNIFEPASDKIAEAIATQREYLKNSTTWSVSAEELI